MTGNPALADGTNPDVWLPRDLTLAGVLVFAGCLMAVFLTDRNGRDARAAFLLSLAGGLVGALLAWQTGVLAGRLWGGPAGTSGTFLNAGAAFSLRSLSVLLLWPAATATSVFILSLLRLLKGVQGPDGTPVAGGGAPGA